MAGRYHIVVIYCTIRNSSCKYQPTEWNHRDIFTALLWLPRVSCLDLLGVDGVAWVQGTGKHSIGYYLDESVVSLPQTGQRLDGRLSLSLGPCV